MNENNPDTTHGALVACLAKHRAELIAATGIEYAAVRVEIDGNGVIEFMTYVHGGKHQPAATFAEALSRQVAARDAAFLAAELRERAAKLIAEAAQLEDAT